MQPHKNNRILIVDDEPELLAACHELLQPTPVATLVSSRTMAPVATKDPGFEVFDAQNGELALHLMRTEFEAGRRFAAAIVDVRMPGRIDGLQFIGEAWKIDPDLLVVVATAYQDRSVTEINKLFGEQFQDQWDYLNKPFTSGEIMQKTRQMVSSWNRRQELREHQNTLIAQEQLAAVGRLSRSIGHDFGNILTQLIAKLEITQYKVGAPANSEIAKLFDEMNEAATLGSNICHDLLTFARDRQPLSASGERNPIDRALDKAERLMRHELKKKDIKLIKAIASKASLPIAEPQIIQILVNLVTNAIHASRDGGAIRVEATQSSGGAITLSVADEGCGISPENLKRLFEPLFTTKGEEGNGLGLVVCKTIAEAAGGTIAVESVLGRGTKFTLRFSG